MLRMIVDALPQRLWWSGNTYLVFGRTVHLCVGLGGHRTIEVEGMEVARGKREISDLSHTPATPRRDRLSEIDLGWAALAGAALVMTVVLCLAWVTVSSDNEVADLAT